MFLTFELARIPQQFNKHFLKNILGVSGMIQVQSANTVNHVGLSIQGIKSVMKAFAFFFRVISHGNLSYFKNDSSHGILAPISFYFQPQPDEGNIKWATLV
jgi:hypothetical protein